MTRPHKDNSSRRSSHGRSTIALSDRNRHLLACGGILASILIFFWPVLFQGKTFLSPDNIASHSFDTFLEDARSENIFPLWNPYIFCGYPGYGSLTITGDRWFDFTKEVLGAVAHTFGTIVGNVAVSNILFYYLLLGLGTYLLLWDKLRNHLASFIGAFSTIFSQFIILWVMIGHNTKIMTVWMFPLLFYAIQKLEVKFSYLWSLVLVVLLHFMVGATHVQMAYYGGIAFALYFLYGAVLALRSRRTWGSVIRPAAVLGVAALFALSMDADRYLSVLEYNPYSIRGSLPIVQQQQSGAPTQREGGLDYEYATNWSLAPGELMTFLVPTWYGFGHLTYDGPLTAQPFRFNAYWGPQPFTDGAQYMGVLIFVLAIIGVVRYRHDAFVQSLTIISVFSLIVAFGKELPVLYDPLFAYLPMFNKFRIPSMILVLVQMFVPILAAYGIHGLMMSREASPDAGERRRWGRGLAIGVAAIPALFLFRSAIESLYKDIFPLSEVGGYLMRQFGNVQQAVIQEIYEFVIDVVIADILIGLVVVVVGLGVLHYYRLGRFSLATLSLTLIVVVGVDLWRVVTRPMDPQPRRDQAALFSMPDYVAAVQKDSSEFRTLTFRQGQPPYDNTLAYWRVENAYGYQGAKMRSYQNVVDVAGLLNPLVWKLMNVKYIFSSPPLADPDLQTVFDGQTYDVQEFTQSLPRAFFVNTLEQRDDLSVLRNMADRSFDPRQISYIAEEVPPGIEPPGDSASIGPLRIGIQDLETSIVATATHAVFFSETWYPKGWKAYLDGEEIPIYRFNYMFRGIVVPPGNHTLRMTFEPASFEIGKYVSLTVNILALCGFVGFGLVEYRSRKKSAEPAS